jgi:DNA replication protein DnaC
VSRAKIVADLIRVHARALKMPGLARAFEDLGRHARQENWQPEDYLCECLSVELSSRAESAVKQRLRAAAFPEIKTLDEFEFELAEGVSAQKIADLARCDWIDGKQNVLLAGPIGTGKTHLAIALGVEAARQRRRVAFWRAADLVRTLIEARDKKELGRYLRRLERVDLVVIDELGFVPFDREGGELLFNVLAARHGRRSVCITTNLAFSEWPRVFGGDEKLTTALLDRLAEHAMVIATRGESYRMRKRRIDEPTAEAATAEESSSTTLKKESKKTTTKKSRAR